MTLKLVTYQFNPPRPSGLIELSNELRGSADWSHQIDNVWLVETNETVDQLNARLQHCFLGADRLLIVQLPANAQFQGWMPNSVWEWIRSKQTEAAPPMPPNFTLNPPGR